MKTYLQYARKPASRRLRLSEVQKVGALRVTTGTRLINVTSGMRLRRQLSCRVYDVVA